MIVTDEQYEQSMAFIHDHASEAGALKGKCNGYDYQLKVYEAEGMLHADGAIEKRRAYARTSKSYRHLVNKIKESQERFHDLQAQITFHYARLECWRTECANKRGIR